MLDSQVREKPKTHPAKPLFKARRKRNRNAPQDKRENISSFQSREWQCRRQKAFYLHGGMPLWSFYDQNVSSCASAPSNQFSTFPIAGTSLTEQKRLPSNAQMASGKWHHLRTTSDLPPIRWPDLARITQLLSHARVRLQIVFELEWPTQAKKRMLTHTLAGPRHFVGMCMQW